MLIPNTAIQDNTTPPADRKPSAGFWRKVCLSARKAELRNFFYRLFSVALKLLTLGTLLLITIGFDTRLFLSIFYALAMLLLFPALILTWKELHKETANK